LDFDFSKAASGTPVAVFLWPKIESITHVASLLAGGPY
jgi:hypothetical protein